MVGSEASPAIAGLAIGVAFVVLIGIFPLSSVPQGNSLMLQDGNQQNNDPTQTKIEQGQSIQLNKGVSGSASRPMLVVPDNSDQVYALWISRDLSNSGNSFNLQLSYSKDNGTIFSQPKVIANSTGFQDMQIATPAPNIVYVLWNAEDIFFIKSNDSGQTFSEPINLSESALETRDPSLTASGDSVYVTWTENTENTPEQADAKILFRSSHDYGGSFMDTIDLENILNIEADSSLKPKIASSNESLVLISWTEYYSETDSFSSRLTYSTDGGQTFVDHPVTFGDDEPYLIQTMQPEGRDVYLAVNNNSGLFLTKGTVADGKLAFIGPIKYSDNYNAFGVDAQVLKILFEGENIYIFYAGNVFEGADYYFTKSTDGGLTFSEPVKLFGYDIYDTDISADSDHVYVIRADSRAAQSGMHLLVSTDSGNTFETIDEFKAMQNSTFSSPDIESAGPVMYLLWNEKSQNESKIVFSKDRLAESLSLTE